MEIGARLRARQGRLRRLRAHDRAPGVGLDIVGVCEAILARG